MAQDPLLVDQLQIDPGAVAGGTRLIKAAADGSLQFTDAIVTGGITLAQLAGLRSIGNLLVVGKSGAGAEYTTVQAALDAIPATSSLLNPYFVLVGPGRYKETLNLVRDGVHVIGFGATLASLAEDTPNAPGAYHTLVIQEALGTIPKYVTFSGIRITNAHDAYAAVRVEGGAGSEVAENLIALRECDLINSGSGSPVRATSVNNVLIQGGSMAESSATALVLADMCASFVMSGVNGVPNVQLNYDGGDVPSIVTSDYQLAGCPNLGRGSLAPPVNSTLNTTGKLSIVGCSGGANLRLAGDRSVVIRGSEVGNITLLDSVALSISGSKKGTITSGGTASLSEPVQRGSVAFAADLSKSVAFVTPQPDASYTVGIETDAGPTTSWAITGKTAAGFTIVFTAPQAMNVEWTIHRVLGGATN